MKKFIFLFLFLIVFLSGCTIPYFPNSSGIEPTKPLTISLSSDLTRVKSQDITYLYLILDNLDKKEKYKVSAKIINSGLFDIPESYKETELSGLQKKTLEFKLKAPNVSAETPSKVSVETTISKDFVFYLPILFADSEYLRECETRGEPVQKRQKTYSFSDNLVKVVVELNKEPPIDTGVAYANIKITPLGNGILEFNSISVGEGASCEEINKYSNSVSCEFHSGYVKDIEEKKFEVKIKYDYKEIKSLSFTILPEVAEYVPPSEIPGVPAKAIELEKGGKLNVGEVGYFDFEYWQTACKWPYTAHCNKFNFYCGKKEFEITFASINNKSADNPEKVSGNRGIRLRIDRGIDTEFVPKHSDEYLNINDEKYLWKGDWINNYIYLKYVAMDLKDTIKYECIDEDTKKDRVIEIDRNGEKEDNPGHNPCSGDSKIIGADLTGTRAYFVTQCLKWPKDENCVTVKFVNVPGKFVEKDPWIGDKYEFEYGKTYEIEVEVCNEGAETIKDLEIEGGDIWSIDGDETFGNNDDIWHEYDSKTIKELGNGKCTRVSFSFKPKKHHSTLYEYQLYANSKVSSMATHCPNSDKIVAVVVEK